MVTKITELELIFDSISWDSKWERHIPPSHEIIRVFREDSASQARHYFARAKESTRLAVRSVWLASDSVGQFLAVTEAQQ